MMKKKTMQCEPAAPTSVISPRFLLRAGGLPINCLVDLRFDQTLEWQELLLSLETLLDQQKKQLVDTLHQAVNLHKENQTFRRKLINLKRDIFNNQLSHNASEEARSIAQWLDESDRPLLNAWLDLWDRYQQQLALGPQILANELQQKRSRLKEIINTTDFRKGVLLSSPILHQAIDSYIRSDNVRLNREARTVEHSLLEYLFRTVYKTSPFSTFTSVCAGTIEEATAPTAHDIDLEIRGVEKLSFTRLNMVVLSRLSAQILACLEVRKALPVRITNGWRRQNKHIEYVRRKPVKDNADASLPSDFIQEHVIQLPVGLLLRHLLEFMGDGHEEQLGDIIAHLCLKEPYQKAEATVEEYLQHLLRLGFLIVPALQIDIHNHRPLDVFCQRLRTISTPQTDAVAQYLGTIASLIDTYAISSLAARAAKLEEIKRLLQQCSTLLGASSSTVSLPRTLLYEDTIITPQRLAIYQDSWQEIFTSIHELQQLLPILDINLPQKIMTRGYFQARYGVGQRSDDLFSFADMYNLEFMRLLESDGGDIQGFDSQGKFNGHLNYFNQPEIEMLDKARLAMAEHIGSVYRALPDGCNELVLEQDFYQSIAPLVPESNDLLSHSFFSQFARADKEPLLVLNQIYSGLTLMFSRFAYCFEQDQDQAFVTAMRTVLEQLQPPDAIFAELKGGYDATNLNLHPKVTSYELVCPGELSTRPLEEQIPIEDLFIQDDVNTGCLRLYSKRLGKEVIPIYLGFLIPTLLPEIQRILLHFSYLAMSSLNLWSGTGIADPQASLVFYPRLRYKQIVLQRATWKVQPDILPRRENGETDADFYLAVARWRKKLGLPSKVFFTPTRSSTPEPDTHATDKPKAVVHQSYKPFCVDFENYFSLLLLESVIRKTNTAFLITEMLPQPEQLWFKHENQAYVSEFVFEVSRPRRDQNEKELD